MGAGEQSPEPQRSGGPAALGVGAGEFVGTETHCKSKAHADLEDLAEKKSKIFHYDVTLVTC